MFQSTMMMIISRRLPRTFVLSNNFLRTTTTVTTSGSIQDQIEAKLRANFEPSNLDIRNESFMHNVPRGSETHFRILIVSDCFQGLNTLKRHRMVNKVLQEEFRMIHALAIEAYTGDQWKQKLESGQQMARSPKCLGGSSKKIA